jgi:hypothetical protein
LIGWKVMAVALILAWITARPTQAGILANDSNALSGWHGYVSLSSAQNSRLLSATVDYAVYAPGTFDLSFPGGDPSNNTAYVYAYEFFDSAKPTSTESILQFSVGLHGGGSVANQGYLTPPIGPVGQPSEPTGVINSTAAVWSYDGLNGSTIVQPGQNSEILLFTSAFAPRWDSTAMLASHSLGAQTPGKGIVPAQGNGVPSPTPEPASMFLLAMAASLFGLLGIVRRRFRG